MAKRKTTDAQRLIAIGMAATAEGLNTAIDSLLAIRDARFPKAGKAERRKPRKIVPPKASATTETHDNL